LRFAQATMKLLLQVFLAVALASVANAEVVGEITLAGQTVYVWKQFGDVSVANGAVTMHTDSRAYLLKNNVGSIGQDDFYQMKLNNLHFTYKLDLSRVPCHCNAAAYFNKMPAHSPGEGGDWYCDANYVGGIGCPEYDTLESNKHIVSGALHSCYWDGSWWQGCDSGGCSSNSWDSASGQVCPGCSIDTQGGPFTVSHFQSPDQANIWMSQNGNEASFDICYGNGDYLNTMSEYWEDGMVLAFSLWGSCDNNDMWWLDDRTGCQGEGGCVGCDIGNAWVTWSGFDLW